MRVIILEGNRQNYSCNVYFVLGDWNGLEDVNSLIDVGLDGSVIPEIDRIPTGIGKKQVAQVILTHSHYDHAGGLATIVERYKPKVYAFAPIEGVDHLLVDHQVLRLGDRSFEVIHTPGHSDDSICLYSAQDRVLFSGDTPLNVKTAGGSYSWGLVGSLEKISERQVKTIYSGHAYPVTIRAQEMVDNAIENIKRSTLCRSMQS